MTIKSIEVSCSGGGPGGGWWIIVSWTPWRSGYVMQIASDSVSGTSDRQRKRSSKPLTLKAVVKDCLRYPEVRVYGDFYGEVSVEGLSLSQADVVKLAFVEDEDQPVPSSLIDYLLVQPAYMLESIRRA